jgi:hypothetical protein
MPNPRVRLLQHLRRKARQSSNNKRKYHFEVPHSTELPSAELPSASLQEESNEPESLKIGVTKQAKISM